MNGRFVASWFRGKIAKNGPFETWANFQYLAA